MGLQSSPSSPCIFVGHLIEGAPPIYVGIYVDDIIHFSLSDEVERKCEGLLSTIGNVDFMGQVSHFLGIEFSWKHHSNGHLSVCLTQQSFIDTLLDSLGLSSSSKSTFTSPYRSGLVIDAIKHQDMPSSDRDALCLLYQSLVGSLNWLAHTTRPDLCTVVSLLAQHQSNLSPGHYDAALYAMKYTGNTKHSKNFHRYYNFLLPVQCLLSLLIYWVHYIGCPRGKLLLPTVLLKQKSMLPTCA
jgi:hypothetical protein